MTVRIKGIRESDGSTVEVESDKLGGAVVRGPFAFAFDTPGLTEGVPFYTPTVADLILDVLLYVTTAWDGTTPKCDFGTFSGTNHGLRRWSYVGDPGIYDLTVASDHGGAGVGLRTGAGLGNTAYVVSTLVLGASGPATALPAIVTVANPLKVVVSQTGAAGGADPGASQGAAVVYVITATPVLL